MIIQAIHWPSRGAAIGNWRTKRPAREGKGPRGGPHPAVTVVRSFSGASIMWSGSKLLPVPRIVTLP